jgi:hypothetical protein
MYRDNIFKSNHLSEYGINFYKNELEIKNYEIVELKEQISQMHIERNVFIKNIEISAQNNKGLLNHIEQLEMENQILQRNFREREADLMKTIKEQNIELNMNVFKNSSNNKNNFKGANDNIEGKEKHTNSYDSNELKMLRASNQQLLSILDNFITFVNNINVTLNKKALSHNNHSNERMFDSTSVMRNPDKFNIAVIELENNLLDAFHSTHPRRKDSSSIALVPVKKKISTLGHRIDALEEEVDKIDKTFERSTSSTGFKRSTPKYMNTTNLGSKSPIQDRDRSLNLGRTHHSSHFSDHSRQDFFYRLYATPKCGIKHF